MKKIFTILLCVVCVFTQNLTAFAADNNGIEEFENSIPQVVVSENHTEENGLITHEYIWTDMPVRVMAAPSESSQLGSATWHYSRARIVNSITESIYKDSNRVEVEKGTSVARTPKNETVLSSWDYALRSYWGTTLL